MQAINELESDRVGHWVGWQLELYITLLRIAHPRRAIMVPRIPPNLGADVERPARSVRASEQAPRRPRDLSWRPIFVQIGDEHDKDCAGGDGVARPLTGHAAGPPKSMRTTQAEVVPAD